MKTGAGRQRRVAPAGLLRCKLLAAVAGAFAAVGAPGHDINRIIGDMSSPSEAMVIDPRFDWQARPAITMHAPRGDSLPDWWTGNRPQWTFDVLSWFTAFEAEGNAASNTRVEVRNLRLYLLSEASRTWSLVDVRMAPAVELWKYPFDHAGRAAVRIEADGGVSVKPKYPYFFHGYGNPKTIVPQDVRAVYVALDFRLVRDQPGGPDDRSRARYVVDCGGDYYPGKDVGWNPGYAPGMGNGRMLLAQVRWRTATLLVPNQTAGSSFRELRQNPPPLNLAGEPLPAR